VIPTAPLRARNRFAAAVMGALGDAGARRLVERLAGDRAALESWLGADDRGAAERLWPRARAAAAALERRPLADPAASLASALEAAGVLFDAGLGFEVHEVLEPHWADSVGERREALQGLIQVAIGFQHLANGNLDGARALLAEGAARLHGRRLDGLALGDFAARVAAAAAGLGPGATPVPPRFPR